VDSLKIRRRAAALPTPMTTTAEHYRRLRFASRVWPPIERPTTKRHCRHSRQSACTFVSAYTRVVLAVFAFFNLSALSPSGLSCVGHTFFSETLQFTNIPFIMPSTADMTNNVSERRFPTSSTPSDPLTPPDEDDVPMIEEDEGSLYSFSNFPIEVETSISTSELSVEELSDDDDVFMIPPSNVERERSPINQRVHAAENAGGRRGRNVARRGRRNRLQSRYGITTSILRVVPNNNNN